MTIDERGDSAALIGIADIASIAGVTRSAVGNWRKRHEDFPVAHVQTPSGALFNLTEIEVWLAEHGKIDRRVSPASRLWALANSARGLWAMDDLTAFIVAGLVFLEYGRRTQQMGPDQETQVSARLDRAEMRNVDVAEFPERLLQVAEAIEAEVPELDSLMSLPFARLSTSQAGLAKELLTSLDDSIDDVTPAFAVYEEALAMLVKADRFAGVHGTPGDICHLVSQLVDVPGGTVIDFAVGEGGLLLMAALGEARDEALPMTLVGIERDERTAALCRSRFYLYDVPADIRAGNSLTYMPDDLPQADGVVIDPPYSLSDWGDAETYLNSRWIFGAPSPKSADLAWLQLAVTQLKPGGRAAVILPTGSLSRGGRDGTVRQSLIDASAVEAVVLLPGGIRTDTAISVAVWLLRSPIGADPEDLDVLFIDATRLAEAGKWGHTIPEEAIDTIVGAVERWRTDRIVSDDHEDLAWRVAPERIADNGGVLDPRRYRPLPELDPAEFQHLADELVPQVTEDLNRLSIAGTLVREIDELAEFVDAAAMERKNLNQVCSVRRGRATGGASAEASGHLVFGVPEVTGSGQGLLRFSEIDLDLAGSEILDPGDLVIALAKAPGAAAIVGEAHSGAILTRDCVVVRPARDVTTDWLRAWTGSEDFRRQAETRVTGTAVSSLPLTELIAFSVPLAPIDYQEAAGRTLRRIDETAELAASVAQKLTELHRIEATLAMSSPGRRN